MIRTQKNVFTRRPSNAWKGSLAKSLGGMVIGVSDFGKQSLAFTPSNLLMSVDGIQWQSRPNDVRLKIVFPNRERLLGRDYRTDSIHVRTQKGISWKLSSSPQIYHLSKVIQGDLEGTAPPPTLPTVPR